MHTTYNPPLLLFNAHLETIYPALFRRVKLRPWHRERIATPDDDFLDLDWLTNGSGNLAILSHGLEGNSRRVYIRGMARAFSSGGYDVLAWNFRGCSEEMNKQLRFYHSGATDDLSLIVDHAISRGYKRIFLIGFSLGGNLTLKFLGEGGTTPNPFIRGAVTFSVPLDLYTSSIKISKASNWMYEQRFLASLKNKIRLKASAYPDLDTRGLSRIKTLIGFDDAYTAPLHGFSNAVEYYQKCSALKFVSEIRIPTLIVNARNDPFLSNECYPVALLKNHPHVTFISPERGGHVGFTLFDQNGLYWSELQALTFIDKLNGGQDLH